MNDKYGLIYKGRVVFELYRACLKNNFSKDVFVVIKYAIDSIEPITLEKAIEDEKILKMLETDS